jgi:NTE family protein
MSSFAVLGRSISVMINANELRSMEDADLVVSVPVQKYTGLDFDKADEIIQAGYDAAAAKAKILLTLPVDDATWNQYIAERIARRRSNPIPTFVTSTA